MSKKPTLTIRYPEASEKALKLTEAMVKRSPGKRVVETESEDPIFPDGGDLFSSFIRCKTSTGVDLTLTLNPASMDFALETLIRPNLNADERKQILGEDTASSEEALPGLAPAEDQQNGAQAARTPGQALDGGAATQSGEQALILKKDITAIIENSLQDNLPNLEHTSRIVIADDLARRLKLHTQIECDPNKGYDRNCIEIAIATLICAAGNNDWSRDDLAEWADHIIDMLNPSGRLCISNPSYLATKDISMYTAKAEIQLGLKDITTAKRLSEELEQEAYQERTQKDQEESQETKCQDAKPSKAKRKKKPKEPSWDDVEKAAQTIGQKSEPASEPAGEADQDTDIEPGLLNDLDEDKKEGREE